METEVYGLAEQVFREWVFVISSQSLGADFGPSVNHC